jgi:hypothetical protein
MDALWRAVAGSVVRWGVTILAAKGLIVSDEQYGQLVNGALVVGMLAWSAWQKRQVAKRGVL